MKPNQNKISNNKQNKQTNIKKTYFLLEKCIFPSCFVCYGNSIRKVELCFQLESQGGADVTVNYLKEFCPLNRGLGGLCRQWGETSC
jgi:hypothetical protein